METKKCSQCGQYKPVDNFYKSSVIKCGYRSECKTCSSKWYSRFKSQNPQLYKSRVKKYNKTYKTKHPQRIIDKKRRDRWNLHQNYIVSMLVKSGFDKEFVLANPSLIEARRLLIKINRIIKNKKLNQDEKKNN